MTNPKIIYTLTDEAPALATYSFLPIVKKFISSIGVDVDTADISLSARILAGFPDYLTDAQKVEDTLAELGKLVVKPEANVIKLPNISASVPQLKAAIEELQGNGFKIPNFPEDPHTDEEKEIRARYNKAKGSAVNPVLREGNSDRRAPKAVKEYAKAHPHSMGAWKHNTKSHVATMKSGDFAHNEKSFTAEKAMSVKIQHTNSDGKVVVLKELDLLAGEVFDGTYLSKTALLKFLSKQIKEAKKEDILFSLHMKATMMKVSDPIIFGHAVRVYFKNVFKKHAATLDKLGVDVNNGFGDLLEKIAELPDQERKDIEIDIAYAYANGPGIAMVDSDKGITNLHVPSDVIIDASIPAMIRTSGNMWNSEGKLEETKVTIPDSSYASLYSATFDFCKKNGAFDPTKMGSVSNVGLMAQKAEEYGSHDKTFEIASEGKVTVVDANDRVLMTHEVEEGDIWRACQAKDAPILDWVQLAVRRAKATQVPAIFWLDEKRAHDAELIKKVTKYLRGFNLDGLRVEIMSVKNAAKYTLQRAKDGLDTISVTGNVLRDYLTDLFPIIEVGTSAKMLSIVPLMAGGGLFETGAGGSAPKHVQQFNKENHLRWDSLGEFLALAVSLDHLGEKFDNKKARIMGQALDDATTKYLLTNKSPSRKVKELDNRGSHFYLAMYWAQALVEQKEDTALASQFKDLADALAANESKIINELNEVQGPAVDIGGYYLFDPKLAEKAMRPSSTLNAIINA